MRCSGIPGSRGPTWAPDIARAFAIVNPAAGGGTARGAVDPVLGTLRQALGTVDVAETGALSPTAEDLAAGAVRDGYDAVIVAGGDGTVGAVARAVVGTDITLGILPFGSYMNIARALGIPRDDPHAAAQVIASGATRRIDVGEVAGQVFFEAAGIGLDAEAFRAGRAIARGDRSFAAAALGALLRRSSTPVRIVIDGRVHRHRILQAVVCNGSWYGWGFEVAPAARIDDGMLELVVFGDGRLRVIREFVAAAVDRDRPAHGRRYRGKRIVLSAERGELVVHADGQIVGPLPQTFTVRPKALRVYAPR